MSQHHEEAGKRWFKVLHRKTPLTCTAPRFHVLGPFFVDVTPLGRSWPRGTWPSGQATNRDKRILPNSCEKRVPLRRSISLLPQALSAHWFWAFLLREILPSQNEIFRKARARIYSTTQNASFPTAESRKCLKNHLPSSSPFPHPFSQVAPPTPTTRPSNLLTA